NGETVTIPSGEVDVTGRVSLTGLDAAANILYVVDASGSTIFTTDLDCNGNGVTGEIGDNYNDDFYIGSILDCEISGIQALNSSLFGVSGLDVGMVVFGSTAILADVMPASGYQIFTTPPDIDQDGNTINDLEEVGRSLGISGYSYVSKFTTQIFNSGTYFEDALDTVNQGFATQPENETNVAFFLSDGESLFFNPATSPALATAVAKGTIINTFSIGSYATGCGTTSDLQQIAVATGGTCTEVIDPSDLAAALPGVTPTGIDRVEVSLNGAAAIPATLNALGVWSLTPLSGLVCGTNTIQATVYATDGTTVTADTTVQGECSLVITLSPINAVNPAGVRDSVLATVTDPFSNPLENEVVQFATSGVNDTAQRSTTNSAGQTSFAYIGHNAGVDTITAWIDLNDNGLHDQNEPSSSATKTWETTTAVTLIDFSVTNDNETSILTWQTASEIDNEGFNVWRSSHLDGPYTKVNSALIPALGDTNRGYTYQLTDSANLEPTDYYYVLEDIDTAGISTFHTAISTEETLQPLYLPIILRQ
ncbi:MAG: Ig-like domain-containing protein, partial [Chloroflexota bacterium]